MVLLRQRRALTSVGRRPSIRSPGGAKFSPLDLAPHAWYRADDVVLSGSSITTWTDKSGNGNDLVQGTGSAQPTQVTRYGRKSASFDGGDNVAGAYHAALTQPYTIVLVGEITNFTSARVFVDSDDGANRAQLRAAQTTGVLDFYAGGFHTGQTLSAATVAAICVAANGASSEMYLDDFTDGAVDSGSSGAQAADGLTIGAGFSGGTPLLGFVSEVVVLNTLITTAERKSLGDYFTARYTGLTVTT
jgi:hypothetical protein